MAVIGPGTAWQPGVPLKRKAITDRLEDTILLVEMKNSGIGWGEPRDLDLRNLPPGITTFNLIDSLSEHPTGFHAVFADGSIAFVSKKISWNVFMGMLSIAGGETIDQRWKIR